MKSEAMKTKALTIQVEVSTCAACKKEMSHEFHQQLHIRKKSGNHTICTECSNKRALGAKRREARLIERATVIEVIADDAPWSFGAIQEVVLQRGAQTFVLSGRESWRVTKRTEKP